jgi:surface carbohydrate biosynthesis protein
LDVRGESVYFFIAITAWLSRNSYPSGFGGAYISKYLKIVKPKLILTFIDNDVRFWEIKAQNPATLTYAIQNGQRVQQHYALISSRTDLGIDRMFCFGKGMSSLYLGAVSVSGIVAIGSFRSNRVSISKTSRSGVGWISQYTASPSGDSDSFHSLFHSSDSAAFKIFANWSGRRGIHLSIILRNLGIEAKREQEWYRNILTEVENQPSLSFHIGDSYGSVDSSEMIASVDSTLGLEALARGTRSFFFSYRSSTSDDPGYQFGWPLQVLETGDFWTASRDELEISKLLDNVLAESPARFFRRNGRFINQLMTSDPGNVKFWSALEQFWDQYLRNR